MLLLSIGVILISRYAAEVNLRVRLRQVSSFLMEDVNINEEVSSMYLVTKFIYQRALFKGTADRDELDAHEAESAFDYLSLAGPKINAPGVGWQEQVMVVFLNIGQWLQRKPLIRTHAETRVLEAIRYAFFYERNKKYQKAIRIYDRLLDGGMVKNTRAKVLLHRGFCRALSGDFEAAEKDYLAVMNDYPHHSLAMTASVLLNYLNVFRMEQRIAASASLPIAQKLRRMTSLLNFRQAIALLEKAPDPGGDHTGLIDFYRGVCHEELGEYEKAVQSYLSVLRFGTKSEAAKYANRRLFFIAARSKNGAAIRAQAVNLSYLLKDRVMDRISNRYETGKKHVNRQRLFESSTLLKKTVHTVTDTYSRKIMEQQKKIKLAEQDYLKWLYSRPLSSRLFARALYPAFNPGGRRGQMRIKQSALNQRTEPLSGAIQNSAGTVVRQWSFNSSLPAEVVWNGKTARGPAAGGTYIYVLTGTDVRGVVHKRATEPFVLHRKSPALRITPDRRFFSPDTASVIKTVGLSFFSASRELTEAMTVTITDVSKKTVWIRRKTHFIKHLSWNGRLTGGGGVPEGRYAVEASIQLKTGDHYRVKGPEIVIDKTPVVLTVLPQSAAFSPNNDGRLDRLTVVLKKKKSAFGDAHDRILLVIRDQKNKQVYSTLWQGNPPALFYWDGRGNNREPQPEGKYSLSVICTDAAGNGSVYTPAAVILVRRLEKMMLTASALTIGRTVTRRQKSVTITPTAERLDMLTDLTITAVSRKGRVYRLKTMARAVPFQWYGSDEKNRVLPDGLYDLTAQARYVSGNAPRSPAVRFLLDTTPPVITMAISPEYFSPDGDGQNDLCRIRVGIKDANGVGKGSLHIFRYSPVDSKGRALKQEFSAYGAAGMAEFKSFVLPADNTGRTLSWDGMGTRGQKVESATDYACFFRAVDGMGNRAEMMRLIRVDILVETLPDGRRRVMLWSIHFKSATARMTGNYVAVLARLFTALRRQRGRYSRITIVGHTDSRGTLAYNQALSLKRAMAVRQYLIVKGLDAARLAAVGKGKSELLIKNESVENEAATEENRRLNRRVEFFLE